jgi:malate dehydrogenase (oxaloacetate-decarboxylating)
MGLTSTVPGRSIIEWMPTRLSVPAGLRGMNLLNSPVLNQGTAFSLEARDRLGLHGLLPPYVETLEQQAARRYASLQEKTSDIEKHIFLRALQDTNEVLFYRLLLEHIPEVLPLVYTPTVAAACERFSQIYRRPRGIFISYPLRDRIPEILANRPNEEVDVVVVTDGERILGIGDQGVGGLAIPIGKLSLYSLIGGVPPWRTLPVVLDVGTNNTERLKDPAYLGWHHERITGQPYFDFIDQFVSAVKKEMPRTCLQWEDFATAKARPLLDRYRNELLTFNDDIQGTAAVALGAIVGATKLAGKRIREHEVVFFGAGSAAIGVADYLCDEMRRDGLSAEEARRRIWIVDRRGLVHDRREGVSDDKRIYAQPFEAISSWAGTAQPGLEDVIMNTNASVLIGLSTVKGAFSEKVVKEMARRTERPIILPLSNPTERSEATASDLIRWTEGKALVATGSPFAPVSFDGRPIEIAQCNNVYVFPAVGLGVIASGASRVTDAMMLAASRALGIQSPALKDPAAPLLPRIGDIRSVARELALAVALEAQNSGLAPKTSEEALGRRIADTQWTPEYATND